MSWRKRQLQRLGSWVVRQVSNTSVPDTTSGFRAYTREAALRMTIVSEFWYTLETIIQAGKKRMAIAHVPVSTNPRTRESRLFDSLFWYIKRSAATIVRIYAMYEPLKVFTYIGLTIFGTGVAGGIRFLYYLAFVNRGTGHLQSLILSAVLMIVGFQVILIGLLADVISANRKLLEDLVYRVRSLELPKRPESVDAPDRLRPPRPRALAPAGTPLGALTNLAEPSSVSVVIPAYNEAAAIADVVASWPPRVRGTRSSWSTTGRRTARVRARSRPEPRSCGIRTTKGTARRSRAASARATGEYMLIVDGDGQHPGEDAVRLTERLGEYRSA